RLVHIDGFNGGSLNEPTLRRSLQPHVVPTSLAENHRGGVSQEHTATRGQEVADLGFAPATEILVLVVGRGRRLRGTARHGLGERRDEPVHWRVPSLVNGQPLTSGWRRHDVSGRTRHSLEEWHTETLGQGGRDDAAPSAIRGRNGDE